MSAIAALTLELDNSDVSEKVKESTGLFAKLGSTISNIFAGRAGMADSNEALASMQGALVSANAASSPLAANMLRLEGTLHGAASVARIATTAIAIFPKVFDGIPPAITRTLNSLSLASRAMNVFRGELSPVGGALAYLEMRNLGVRKSYAALAATVGVATSGVMKAGRSISTAATTIGQKGGRAFGGVASMVSALAISAGGLAMPLVGVAGVAGTAAVAVSGLKSAFDFGGDIDDLSNKTGIAAKQLVIARHAFKLGGMEAENAGPAINRLQKALAGVNEDGEPTNKVFDALKLNMAELREKTPLQQLQATGKAIMGITDPAQRAAAAMGIFGKSGGDMLQMFADPKIFSKAAVQVGYAADILGRQSSYFAEISDGFDSIGPKIQGFFIGAADKLAPVIGPIMKWFAGVDLAGIGQRAGAAIAGVVGAFTDGSLWDAFGASLVATFQYSVNAYWKHLRGVLAGWGAYGGEVVKNMITLFSVITRPSFWAGIGNALMSMAASFNAMMLDGVAGLLDALRNVPGVGKGIGKAADFTRGQADAQRAFAARDGGAATDALAPAFREFQDRLIEASEAVGKAYADAADSAGDIVDTTANDVFLNDSVGRLMKAFEEAARVRNPNGADDKKTPFDMGLAKDLGSGAGSGPKAERLFSLSGFGLFVRDPLAQAARAQLQESKKQTGLLETIAKNTGIRPTTPMGSPDRFS